MRPVKLTMKAFGSFAQETVVDFDKLDGGLYLIVGKTGAGKTTIFDAISFALFGEPSGSEREVEMFHSDFVPMSENTVVKLHFVHNGKNYYVERTIHFRKTRGTDVYGDAEKNAVLTGDGMQPVEKMGKVTTKCEEILGMNGNQFRRIVMLAQGEFREFMKADSDAKGKILGKLFDSTEYVRYQSLFKAVRDDLNGKVKQQRDNISNAMKQQFTLPDGEEESAYLPGNPHLEENLRGLAVREQAKLTEFQTACEQWNKTVGELNTRKGAAETNNSLFDELSRRRAHLAALDTQKETVAESRRIYEAAEKAQHGVKPLDDAFNNARNDYEATEKKLREQKALFSQRQAAVSEAQKHVEADAPLKEQMERLKNDVSVLEPTIPRYKELSEAQSQHSACMKKLMNVKSVLADLETKKEQLSSQLTQHREEIKTLDGSAEEAANLNHSVQELKKRSDSVGIISRVVSDILKKEKALDAEKSRLITLSTDAANAEKYYHELYQRFISGQAGLLARNLEQELAEKGEALCPVCKTHFCRGDRHQFEVLSDHVPSKNEVDNAEKYRKTAEEKRSQQEAAVKEQSAKLEERKKTAVEKLREEEYDCADWQTLIGFGYLDGIIAELAQRLEANRTAAGNAQKKAERKSKLEKDVENIIAEQEKQERERAEKDRERQQIDQNITGLASKIEVIKKQLSYASEAEAGQALADLNKRISEWQSILNRHEETLRNALETANRTEGAVKQLEDSLPGKKEALQKAQNDLADSVRANGFGSYEDYRRALGTIVGSPENWLRARKTEIDSYHNDVRNTGERVRELEQQTEGKEMIDLARLNSELNDAQSKQAETERARTVQYNLLSSHQGVLAIVENANKALAGLEGAFRRMDRLAGLAGGASGEGGKLSFERYVMGAIFQEVLEKANRRLNIMTGGRFELIHKIEADHKASAAGMGMEVLDISTGKQRPSASISGGEGFMVSLALALGLSDVVQSHAGGKKLDTLFIDEGFGTLDDGKLDNVIQVLQQLTEGNRLVGIISHVDKLEESIPQKLRVSSGEHGSTVSMELS